MVFPARYGADSCVANPEGGGCGLGEGANSSRIRLLRIVSIYGDLRNLHIACLLQRRRRRVTHPAETVTSARNRLIRVVRSWTRWRPVIRKRPGQAAAGHRSGCKRRSPGERHSPVDCVFGQGAPGGDRSNRGLCPPNTNVTVSAIYRCHWGRARSPCAAQRPTGARCTRAGSRTGCFTERVDARSARRKAQPTLKRRASR